MGGHLAGLGWEVLRLGGGQEGTLGLELKALGAGREEVPHPLSPITPHSLTVKLPLCLLTMEWLHPGTELPPSD